jgi:hypothetical protein
MPKRYFDLSDDEYIPKRWYLGEPLDQRGNAVDPWQFRQGRPVHLAERLKVPIDQKGLHLDFTTTLVGITPIVHAKVAALLRELAPNDVQLLPVDIEGEPEPYFLMNTLRTIKCIDDERCEEVLYWLPEDERPEKTGTYRNVAGLRIDPSKVGDTRIFRPWGWNVVLIVSQDVQQALERMGVTGICFEEV